MLVIKKMRENDDGTKRYDRIGTFADGEFSGPIEESSFIPLEAETEESVQRALGGPRVIAVRPEVADQMDASVTSEDTTPKESRHNRDVSEFGVADLQGAEAVDWLAEQRNRGQDPRDAAKNARRREASAEYDDGAVVETPDGVGVVTDRFVFDSTFAGKEVTASGDEPAYAVAMKDPAIGFVIAQEPEISPSEITVVDADTDDITETKMRARPGELEDGELEPERATLSVTEFDYPESWEESSTPTRVILLTAYASMGGSFTGVQDEMASEVSNPEAFAAAMKDRVLMTEDWRVGE